MQGDFTRDTFRPNRHFQQVLMQQGRVQLDADWNEQSAIAAHRDETTAADLIGVCGGPAEGGAFAIITDPVVLAGLPGEGNQPIRQFALTSGHYYVNGILCEVEAPFLFSWQPDHREFTPLPPGDYLVYLDVWRRHVTVHEDEDIREPALGGPDTATRVRTVWQVRCAPLQTPIDQNSPPADFCHQPADEFDWRQRTALPRIAARTAVATADTEPCTISAEAGFRGLENQLYRVEIHSPGSMGTATFKWSRENGAVVTRVLKNETVPFSAGGVSVDVNRLTVTSTGPDDHSGFRKGCLVEILHESEELEGRPGTLALVADVNPGASAITLTQFNSNPMPVLIDLASNPRLRRWDGIGVVTLNPAVNDGFVGLENGVEVRFEQPVGAEFRTGDNWQIPARTASPDALSGKIEWPASDGVAEFLSPKGIRHDCCRLGVVSISSEGTVTPLGDCRCLWPAITAVPQLFYVSGDGQEVMPDLSAAAESLVPLPHSLIVGMGNAHCLKRLVRVRFSVVSPGGGRLAAAGEPPTAEFVDVVLGPDGLARCDFHLDSVHANQQVTARVLNADGVAVSLPVIFNANLSTAVRVAYQPRDCAGLAGQFTVQAAIDRLAEQASIHKVSGDAQTGPAGQPLPQVIEVLVANRCGPVRGVPVRFTVQSGGGTVSVTGPVITGVSGRAACRWTPGNSAATQELDAAIPADRNTATAPVSVRFTSRVTSVPAADPGMRIRGVFVAGVVSNPLRLGMNLPVTSLQPGSGLRIDCDREVDVVTVRDGGTVNNQRLVRGEPTCFVTVEVPIPLSAGDRRANRTHFGREIGA